MVIKTWLDRITDETNLWFSAVKAEERGDLGAAAALFLSDAAHCLQEDMGVRSALSCYSAADCLSRAGSDEVAKRLFLESGILYSEAARKNLSGSIRESIWALQRAYACFVLAGDSKEAERVKGEFDVLARRANPFVGQPGQGLQEPRRREGEKGAGWGGAQGDPVLEAAINRFQALRRRLSEGKPETKAVLWRGEPPGQEGIVSQLG